MDSFFPVQLCAISLILIFGLLFLIKSKKEFLPSDSNLILASTCFLIFYACSLLWSSGVPSGLARVQIATVSVFTFFGFTHLIRNKQVGVILRCFLLLNSILIVVSLSDFYLLFDLDFLNSYKASSVFSHKNTFGSFLLFSFFISVYSIGKFKSRLLAAGNIIVLSALFIICLLLQNRTIILALAGAAFAFILMRVGKATFLKIASVLGIVSLLILFIAEANIDYLLEIVVQKNSLFNFDSLEERFKVWNKTILLWQENVLFGSGTGSWKFDFLKFGVSDIYTIHSGRVSFSHPHNEILNLLAENGLIGLLLFSILIVTIIKPLLVLGSWNYHDRVLVISLTAIFIVAFFSFPFSLLSHSIFISFFLALAYSRRNQQQTLKPIKGKGIVLTCAVIVLVFNGYTAYYYFKGNYYAAKILKAKEEGDFNEVINNGTKAISGFYTTDYSNTPIASYLGDAYNKLDQNEQLLTASKQALDISPYNAELLTNYGFGLMKNNQEIDAEVYFLKSIELNKYHDPSYINLAVLKYNEGDYEAAATYLDGIVVKGDYFYFLKNKIQGKLKSD